MKLTRRHFAALGGAALATQTLPAFGQANDRRMFIDSAGRNVAVPARVQRVFAAGPPAAILLYTLAPDTLIGWTSAFSPAEQAFVPARYGTLPGLGRLTGRGNTANVEVVLAVKPDLVFDYGAVAPTFTSLADRVQEQTGVPYVLIDGNFPAIEAAYERLGVLLGIQQRATELIAATRAILQRVDAILARVPTNRRPRVYYARGPKGLNTGLTGSINVESIERVGAINVAGEALGKGGLATVSLEQILAWNPDTIVTFDENFHRDVAADPSWRGVAAVRNRRVFLSPVLPFGWVDSPPSVNRLIGLLWLTAILYPQEFDGDLRRDVRGFYTRFYHQTPTNAQLNLLLRNAGVQRP